MSYLTNMFAYVIFKNKNVLPIKQWKTKKKRKKENTSKKPTACTETN